MALPGELGAVFVSVAPSMAGVVEEAQKQGGRAAHAFADAFDSVAQTRMRTASTQAAQAVAAGWRGSQADVQATFAAYEAATRGAEAAATRLATVETDLAEKRRVSNNYVKEAFPAAELEFANARRAHIAATDAATAAELKYKTALAESKQHTDAAGESMRGAGAGADVFKVAMVGTVAAAAAALVVFGGVVEITSGPSQF